MTTARERVRRLLGGGPSESDADDRQAALSDAELKEAVRDGVRRALREAEERERIREPPHGEPTEARSPGRLRSVVKTTLLVLAVVGVAATVRRRR